MNPSFDCAVIGAGISGVTIATELTRRGLRMLILEKSRGLGGRLATRRWGDETSPIMADTGAQYWPLDPHAHEAPFADNSELITLDADASGNPARIVHARGMSRLARGLLETKENPPQIELGTRVLRLDPPLRANETWSIHTSGADEGTRVFQSRDLVLALPIPQSIELLDSTLPIGAPGPTPWDELRSLHYSRCLTVIATLREGTSIRGPAIRQFTDPGENADLAGIFLQEEKGLRTSRPTVVVQASPSRSLDLWNDDPNASAQKVWNAARTFLSPDGGEGVKPETLVLHRWRYARPEILSPKNCALYPVEAGQIGICGDAFATGGITGALASARELSRKISMR